MTRPLPAIAQDGAESDRAGAKDDDFAPRFWIRPVDGVQGEGADTVFDNKEQMVKPRRPARGNCDLCYSLMSVS